MWIEPFYLDWASVLLSGGPLHPGVSITHAPTYSTGLRSAPQRNMLLQKQYAPTSGSCRSRCFELVELEPPNCRCDNLCKTFNGCCYDFDQLCLRTDYSRSNVRSL
ncbi:Ectonucleotide pyrophosphatase/phosphodiesterase family member 2 [Liparis tanakae]|uniref:Ectonucleotide pyrophosphatase/phosphodiesterase family member 2 n=1 Tax=Liparis tanakae TaxID=230148 RepID=A0A4Z2GLH5_9TELE|nr:Ectonucleotide pyrophosphatase/phosphodiesterase family member 2 [Liparis tanakae]